LPRVQDAALRVESVDAGYIHAERLLKLREYVGGHPLATEERIAGYGLTVHEEEKHRHALYLESLRTRKRRKSRDGTESALDMEMEKELFKRLQGPQVAHEPAQNDESKLKESIIFIPRIVYDNPQTPASGLLASSPVVKARIGCSTSSKLNYILNDVSK
jgi:hypothetical protein